MAEINNALGPLVRTVDKQGRLLYSLYSNGSGGPPGYLEMARAEDNKRFSELFKMIDELGKQSKKASDFINAHGAQEAQREQDRVKNAQEVAESATTSERKFKRHIAIFGVVLALITLLISLLGHFR